MAVAVDTVGAGATGNASSLNYSHTAGGSNRHGLVFIRFSSGTISSVTWGAISCSEVSGTLQNNAGSSHNTVIYSADSEIPASAQTITVNFSGMNQCSMVGISFTGVDTTTPTSGGTGSTADAATSVSDDVTSATDDLVADIASAAVALTEGSGQTKHIEQAQGGLRGAVSTEAGATTTTMSWTFASSDTAHSACNIKAASGSSATVTPAAIAGTFAAPAVSIAAAATVTPSAIARSFAVDQVSPLAAVLVTPATIARSFAVDAVTISVSQVVTPATIARSFVIDAVSPLAAVLVSPSVIARSFALDAVTIGVSQVVTPATIARSFVIDQASVTAGATVSPADIALAFTVDAVAIPVDVTVSPAVIAQSFALDAVSIAAAATVTPNSLSAVLAVPQASYTIDAAVTPASFAATVAVPAVTIIGPANVTPATIQVVAVLPQLTIFAPGDKPRMAFRLYRSPNGHLVWTFGGGRIVFGLEAGFEAATDKFVAPITHYRDHLIEPHISAAWEANKAADIAVLKAALHAALNTASYRQPDGTALP